MCRFKCEENDLDVYVMWFKCVNVDGNVDVKM